eukprot:1845368-Prorocentrum_lima.AAC.1
MTSSLVGSEMCIRDSGISSCGVLLVVEAGGAMEDKEDVVVAFSRLLPVSYTHLTLPTICSV